MREPVRSCVLICLCVSAVALLSDGGCGGGAGAGAEGEGTIYYLDDHLGSAHLLMGEGPGAVYERAIYPYGLEGGEDSGSNGMAGGGDDADGSYIYTTKEHDGETDLTYFGARYYSPGIGRWITPDRLFAEDPAKVVDSPAELNLYAFTRNNPINFIDPDGLTSLEFNRREGILRVDPEIESVRPYIIKATSGSGSCMNDPSCEGVRDMGPIPRGEYSGRSGALNDPDMMQDLGRNAYADWGDWRIPLRIEPDTDTHGRSGFYLHGGGKPGTAGCIDIGGGIWGDRKTDRLKHDILNDPDERVPLIVR